MYKNWKIFLSLGILLLVLVVVTISFNVRDSRMTSGSYDLVANEIARDAGSAGISFGVASAPMMKDSAESTVSNQNIPSQDRLIIKTGKLSLVVKDVRTSITQISEYAQEKGGFIVMSDIRKHGLAPYGEITIRIPANVFDSGIDDVKKFGQVESETVNGQDVTEEYVDLDSQLKNLQASERQFLQIMQRAVEIEDVLAVQRELTWVRRDIERIEGRMKYLRESASLSTLTVYLSTDPNVLPTLDETNKWKPWAEVKSAARSLVEVGKGLVNFVIWLVVYIPVWLVIGLVVWLVWRKLKKKNQNI